MTETIHTAYPLVCQTCGQTGYLHMTVGGHGGWSFATVGFIGLAVNRYNPPNSILRCNGCSSPMVRIQRPAERS